MIVVATALAGVPPKGNTGVGESLFSLIEVSPTTRLSTAWAKAVAVVIWYLVIWACQDNNVCKEKSSRKARVARL